MFTVMGFAAFCPNPASALVFSAPKPEFSYTDASGKKQSVEVVDKYYPKKIVKPFAKVDSQIDPKLRQGRNHCRGTRPRALAFQVLAFR